MQKLWLAYAVFFLKRGRVYTCCVASKNLRVVFRQENNWNLSSSPKLHKLENAPFLKASGCSIGAFLRDLSPGPPFQDSTSSLPSPTSGTFILLRSSRTSNLDSSFAIEDSKRLSRRSRSFMWFFSALDVLGERNSPTVDVRG